MAVWTAAGEAHASSRAASAVPFVGLSFAHAAALLLAPSIPVVAIGLWWSANTVAHNFIHRPFFRARALNRAYSAYLSVVLGFPQRLWRDRHLAHHGGRRLRLRWSVQLAVETVLVLAVWTTMAMLAPRLFLTVYVPGWLLGLALCQVHGHYEHARGTTTSYYGRLYNRLFFNVCYHVEHHLRPHADWRTLASIERADTRPSRWPPILRWLEARERPAARLAALVRWGLAGLERVVLRSRVLQRHVVSVHERAFRRLVAGRGDIARATIVGGGLFPRTALVLARLSPATALTIVDGCQPHLAAAARLLPGNVTVVHGRFDPAHDCDTDLVVIPLAFEGDRRLVYERPPAPTVVVHDWIWNRRGRSVVVSWLLCKRLNLVERRSI
jgi:hypothetical protein